MVENQDQEYTAPSVNFGDRIIMISGYTLIMVSVMSFGMIAFLKFRGSLQSSTSAPYKTWLELIQSESTTVGLLLVAIVAATLGKQLLRTARLADARTIPLDDLPLIRQAVIDGKPEPIDQYVRLRALTGMSGAFTKLGVTGLPLTTVLLTLIFSGVALLPIEQASGFLDLAKLTLGAFIGSFVQRQVEQRRQDTSRADGAARRPDLPT